MARGEEEPPESSIEDVIRRLDELSDDVDSEEHRSEIENAQRMLDDLPGTDVIHKYTTRDMGEAFVGGLLFSLPMLVEDGVFDIASWFASFTVVGVPVLLVVHSVLVFAITAGLLYTVDFREIVVRKPIFGFLPRRLVGVAVISSLTAALSMLLWGRLHSGDPAAMEMVSRVSVVWAAASFGAVLADILPGESKGEDISDIVDVPMIE